MNLQQNFDFGMLEEGCIYLLSQCVRVSFLVVSDSLQPNGLGSARLLCPWNFPGSSVHGISGSWSGLPFPSPEGLPDPGIEPRSLALQVGALPSEPPGKPLVTIMLCKN